MQIYVPYVRGKLEREVRDLLNGKAIFVDLTGDDNNYWKFMSIVWREKQEEGFIVVEQDILPTLVDLEELNNCPEDWCNCTYKYHGFRQGEHIESVAIRCLGCTKFSANLLRRMPDVLRIIANYPAHTMVFPPTHWVHLDQLISRTIQNVYKFHKTHIHGEVKHLHKFSPRPTFV